MIEETAQLDTAALPIEEAIRGLRAEDFDDNDLVKGTAEDFEEDEDEIFETTVFTKDERKPAFSRIVFPRIPRSIHMCQCHNGKRHVQNTPFPPRCLIH